MSERYTVELDWIHDTEKKTMFRAGQACDALNRLAAEVATLRDIVQVCRFQPIDPRLIERIDAALAPSGETP